MPNTLAHFAIEADDVERARAFYDAVFGWRFEPWGPPGFYRIHGAGVHGALQRRTGPAGAGRVGFECSFAVDDLADTTARIEEAGGRVIEPRHTIPGVGVLARFRDTEGNQAVVIEYASDG